MKTIALSISKNSEIIIPVELFDELNLSTLTDEDYDRIYDSYEDEIDFSLCFPDSVREILATHNVSIPDSIKEVEKKLLIITVRNY